jgi:hypothetical protein
MRELRDEVNDLWRQIQSLNWRLNATRASIVPATDPIQFAFMDHFSDASINFWYKQINNAAGKTITEPAGSDIVFTITAGVDARWTLGTNNAAPHLCLGNPGYPYYLETKISASSTLPADTIQAGIYVGSGEATGANQTVMFGYSLLPAYLGYWFNDGAPGNPRGPIGLPAYMRMRVSGTPGPGAGYRISAQYSSDGVAWTTYQSVLGTDWFWWASTTYSYNLGLFVRNWGAFPGCIINFDYFRVYRDFGPGGS